MRQVLQTSCVAVSVAILAFCEYLDRTAAAGKVFAV